MITMRLKTILTVCLLILLFSCHEESTERCEKTTLMRLSAIEGIQHPHMKAAEYLAKFGKVRRNPSFDPVRKKKPCLREMTEEERAALIAERPDYGEIVCRCEEVSKGEILDALRSPLPVYTVDAVKRRVRPGMGRCQGGFCSPLVVKIIAEETGMTPEEVTKGNARSNILFGDTKHPGEQQR